MKKILLISCFFVAFGSYAQTKEVAFTLDDRGRLVRVEEQQIRLEKQQIRLEEQQKSLQNQINGLSADLKEFRAEIRADIRMLIYTFFGGIFILIGSIVGFILWDRRTTLAPVVKENNSIKQALIDFSEKDPYMKKALKRVAIL